MRNNKGESQTYQNYKLESEINAITGAEVVDTPIQQLGSCIGGKVYRDLITGLAFTPANLADGVVRTGTWATANSDWTLNNMKNIYNLGNLKTQNGYQKLAGGLIIQWGILNSTSPNTYAVTLPIPFTNIFLGVFMNVRDNVSTFGNCEVQAIPTGLGTFSAKTQYPSSNNYQWIAIGY